MNDCSNVCFFFLDEQRYRREIRISGPGDVSAPSGTALPLTAFSTFTQPFLSSPFSLLLYIPFLLPLPPYLEYTQNGRCPSYQYVPVHTARLAGLKGRRHCVSPKSPRKDADCIQTTLLGKSSSSSTRPSNPSSSSRSSLLPTHPVSPTSLNNSPRPHPMSPSF